MKTLFNGNTIVLIQENSSVPPGSKAWTVRFPVKDRGKKSQFFKWKVFFGRWGSVWEISKKSLMKINCENWTIMLASTLPNVQIWDRLRLPVLLLIDQLTRVRSSDREVPVQSGRQWGCLCPLLLVRMLVILVMTMMIAFWGIVQPGLARSELFFAMLKVKLGPKMQRNLWLRIWHVSPRQR